jgi:flavin reductase (DIM6/NTAB) family NADH-FMN oxidoreductase RutF
VAVVTAAGADAAHIGITVNSFTSVSLDPPLVLWSMCRRSGRHDVFAGAKAFTINILGTEHKEVSARLARAGEHALDGIPLIPTELGPPALADSLAVFECITEKALEAGDHTILLGRVVRFSRHGNSAPLVYFSGKYSALAQGRPPEGIGGRRATDK